ncbi:hypothetical protein [Luteimonas notoginsengisoli]|uniref:ATP-binding protein n=1 Tax=Luteimonas notoginsengisoli TaxID=1578200 RepID=A0ABV7UTA4_9GAMM
MANWEFLPNPGREEEGLGHAGIETFKGSPYPGIARESSQNSLDAAARQPDGTSAPVHLVFRRLSLPAEEIPGLPELRKALRACLDQAKDRNLKKDRDFFERANRVAAQPRIPVLSVEDYGTMGLIGPAVQGKPFHALVKSSGVSQKADADAGGSFGIGKNAAFAISDLRTVFYSTLYDEGKGKIHFAQGKSVLVSHDAGGGEHNRATGYWGISEFLPVADEGQLPGWLRRTEVGTTVASIGFIEEPDWHWQMVESLIRNFFSAINSGAISFTVQWSVDDFLHISPEVLEGLFDLKEVRDAAERAGTIDDLDFSKAMLSALKSSEAETRTEEFIGVGTFRMTLLQSDGFPRRLGILRNGMYISDNLRHFGHAMSRFPMSRDFVAVLEPDDRDTSGRVRDLESPRHDEISAERLDDLSERRKLKAAMKKVGEWVRNTIKSATTRPAGPEVLLDEMNRFFSKPSAGQTIPDPANKNDDPERTKLAARNTSKPAVGAGSQGESGSSGGKKPSKTEGGKTTGGRQGTGRGTAGGRGGKSIPVDALRNSRSSDGRQRIIAFTPGATGTAILEIAAVGVTNDETLDVRSVDGNSSAKAPRLELTDGARKTIMVEFDSPYHGPISVVLTPVAEKSDEN